MRALLADTTCDILTVILIDGDKKYIRKAEGKKGHSPLIMELVSSVFDEAKISVFDIDVFSAVVGPGSFTGIRIGLSAFNALAYATGKKKIEVGAFELLSYGIKNGNFKIDAGNGNSYIAIKKDNKLELSFLEKDEVFNGDFSECNKDIVNAFCEVIKDKFSKGEFCQMLTPLYLRKSQAERNLNANK